MDEGRIDRRTPISIVIREHQGSIVRRSNEIDPVFTPRRRGAGVRWVPKRIANSG